MGYILDWNKLKKPIIANVIETEKEEYIFHNQVKDVIGLCNNISLDYENKYEEFSEDANTVISIVGERGTGKSSLMGTVENVLKCGSKFFNCDENEYLVIDSIDPSLFGSSMRITEILLTRLFKYAQSIEGRCVNTKYDEVVDEIKKAINVLGKIRINRSNYIESNTPIEVLLDYEKQINFHNLLKGIIEDVLSLESGNKRRKLVVCIDDLDMVENTQIYEMTEDIRKYLSGIGIVILAYRESQLLDAVKQKYINDNEVALKHKLFDVSEIEERAVKYIEKFTPYTSKVYLLFENDLYKIKIEQVVGRIITESNDSSIESKKILFQEKLLIDMNNNMDIKEWIYFAIETCVGIKIKPHDTREENTLQIPNNLRGLLDLVKVVSELGKVKSLHVNKDSDIKKLDSSIKKQGNILLKNNEIIYKYFLRYSTQILDDSLKSIINDWNFANVENKNFQMYKSVFHLFMELEKINNKTFDVKTGAMKGFLDITKVQSNNIGLADVYDILEDFKTRFGSNPKLIFFVYISKLLYSLKLMELYVKSVVKSSFDKVEEIDPYLTLLNCYIIPDYVFGEVFLQYKSRGSKAEFKFNSKAQYFKYKVNEITLLDKICNTANPNGGEVNKSARATCATSDDDYRRMYQYRNVFSWEELELINTRNYNADLFAFLGNKKYVELN